jgi:hypothetical protein
MPDRAYTLSEIDRLRAAAWKWYHGYSTNTGNEVNRIEQYVRTFMIAGTDPAEIEEKVKARGRMRRAERTALSVLTGKTGSALYDFMRGY